MAETWLPVVGYEGFYEVSDMGRVRGVDRLTRDSRGWTRAIKGRIRIPCAQKSGHLGVSLSKDGDTRVERVHRLVLTSHLRPPMAGEVCRHLDGDPANNHIGNLAWGSVQENTRDTVRHGHHHLTLRRECPRGHKLEAPNLVAFELKHGHRKCRACHRGRSMCVKENDLSPERLKANSDWQFTRIMNGE